MSAAVGKCLLVKVKYVRCGLHRHPKIRNNLKALGLSKLQEATIIPNNRVNRGRINVVCLFGWRVGVFGDGLVYRLDVEDVENDSSMFS